MTTSYDTNEVGQAKAVKVFQKKFNDSGKRIGLMSELENGFHLGDSRSIVVATIGKSSIDKNQLLNLLIDRPVFGIPNINLYHREKQTRNFSPKIGTYIEAYHDTSTNTIYLNYTSTLDKTTILDFLQNDDDPIYETITREEYLELQCLLFLFFVSNIIFVLHSSLNFDLEWISIFKLLGNMKQSILPDLKSFLKTTFVNSSTITNDILESQYCPVNNVPIILCVFNAKNHVKTDTTSKGKRDFGQFLNLELQVKSVLRKCKINGCKDLYTLDSQCSQAVILGDDVNQNTYNLMLGTKGVETGKGYGIKQLKRLIQQVHKSLTQRNYQHYNKGKERYVKISSLESQNTLLTSRTWFMITEKVKYFLLEEIIENSLTDGMKLNDVDYLFSKECCINAKNIASSVYFHGLPKNNRDEDIHQKRMKKALKVFKSLARGIASSEFEKELINELEGHVNA